MQLTPWMRRHGTQGGYRNAMVETAPDAFDSLVHQFFGAPWNEGSTVSAGFGAAVDVIETDEEIVLRADMPGVDPSQIEITMKQGVLTIAGEKRDEPRGEKETVRVSERRFGAFKRTFGVSVPIDEARIAAEHKHGVLTIRLPKTQAAQPRKIDVRVG